VRALGTRFLVRSDPAGARVAVFEGAVELRPAGSGASALRLQAGEAVDFTRTGWGSTQPAGPGDDAWSRGQLWVDNQRLDDFLAELNRYRPGWLRADPAVAGLRFSGVFPLEDGGIEGTDAVLAMLPGALPVQLRWRTRWWVVVEPVQARG
jgi:transmembrane sensor